MNIINSFSDFAKIIDLSPEDLVEIELDEIGQEPPPSSSTSSFEDRKSKYREEQDPNKKAALYTTMIVTEFNKKSIDSSYELPETAKKAHDTVMTLIKSSKSQEELSQYIINHGKEVAFLTSEKHFLHKHIQAINERPSNEVSLELKGDDLVFHTGEAVRNLISEEANSPETVFYLDAFKIHRFTKDRFSYADGAVPNFKCPKDGKYYVSVCTFTQKNMPTPVKQHSWIRLYDGVKGEVYSLGFYPEKKPKLSSLLAPCTGRIENSDTYEYFTSKRIGEAKIEVTASKFTEVFDKANESLKRSHKEGVTFSLQNHDCADWAIEQISPVYTVDKSRVRMKLLYFAIPSLYEKCRTFENKHPTLFKWIINPITTLLSWALLLPIFRIPLVYAIGGHKTINNTQSTKSKITCAVKDFFKSLSKLFSSDTIKITQPRLLQKVFETDFNNGKILAGKTITIPLSSSESGKGA